MRPMARLPLLSFATLAFLVAMPIASAAAEGDEFWSDRFGFPDVDGPVRCAAEFQGSLVIGGHFQRVSGIAAHGIARWDGSNWFPLGEGFEGDVLSLAVYGGQLVASGRFDRSGTQSLGG